MSSVSVNDDGVLITTCELDTHADTCCFGKHTYILHQDVQNTAEVSPFLPNLGKLQKVPIVSAAVAYDCPHTLETYILVFNQSLYIEQLEHNLLCPNQMRSAGALVHDTPLQYLPANLQTPDAHTIRIRSLSIPLRLKGVISYFHVRKPTQFEIDDPVTYPQIIMTDDAEWDPYRDDLSANELAISSHLQAEGAYSDYSVATVTINLNSISPVYDVDAFVESLQIVRQGTGVSSTTSQKKRYLTPSQLASKWFIGVETAKRTIDRTTQRGIRDFTTTSGTRRLKHTAYQLKFRHLRASVYTDTMFSSVKSLRQNVCAQVYVTSFHWTRIFPMKTKADAHLTLDRLFREVGVFHTIIPDNAMELTSGEFRRKAVHAGSQIKPVEAYTHNQNLAEAGIRELRRMYKKAMLQTGAPHVLWDYCMELMASIRSHMTLNILELEGDTPEALLTGDTPDISNLCEFQWYELVWYIDPLDKLENKKIARYLGPSHDIGQAMASRLLTIKGQQISRTSVIPLSDEERRNPAIQLKMSEYDSALKESLGDRIAGIPVDASDDVPEYEPYGDDETGDQQPMIDADELDYDEFHQFISARVILPRAGEAAIGRVRKRKRDDDGKLIGRSNKNPMVDTSLYEVEFEDGIVETYSANQIAEGIFAQVDTEGKEYALIDEIIDHKKSFGAVNVDDGLVVYNGKSLPRRTTKGWKLCVRWKDGTLSWERLADLKESNPLETAEYAVANKLISEPAFAWWVPYTINKKGRILSRVATRYERRNQKFGITLPKSVKHALDLDQETDTTYWKDAIKKEMSVILPAVRILEDGERAPVGYKQIPCHMVFDVTMDFT